MFEILEDGQGVIERVNNNSSFIQMRIYCPFPISLLLSLNSMAGNC